MELFAKIADGQVSRVKLDEDLQQLAVKSDSMWYSGNLVVSTTQPEPPEEGYIIWINSNPGSI